MTGNKLKREMTQIIAIYPYGVVTAIVLSNGLIAYQLESVACGVLSASQTNEILMAGDTVSITRDMYGVVSNLTAEGNKKISQLGGANFEGGINHA